MTSISSESITEFAEAFVKAQATFPNVSKGKEAKVKMKSGGEYSYTYADLADIIELFRPLLAEHDLAFTQQQLESASGVRVRTLLLHNSGEWMADDGCRVPAPDNSPQGFGSALTYARRYSLLTALGVATEDDDGASAAEASQATTPAAQPAARAEPPLPTKVRGEMKALAVAAGYEVDKANRSVKKLKPSEVEKFRQHCEQLIADSKGGS